MTSFFFSFWQTLSQQVLFRPSELKHSCDLTDTSKWINVFHLPKNPQCIRDHLRGLYIGEEHAYLHLYCAIYMSKDQRLIRPFSGIIPIQSK